MLYLQPAEWKALKNKFIQVSPMILVGLTLLVIGYASGWYMKGSDVVMDCKYANAFRFETTSFTCQRKI